MQTIKEEAEWDLKLDKEIVWLRGFLLKRGPVREAIRKDDQNRLAELFLAEETALETALKNGDVDAANLTLFDMRILFGKVTALKDRITYYEGLIAYANKDYAVAQRKLEDVVWVYQNSYHKEKAVRVLESLYFNSGQDTLVVKIHSELKQPTDTQRYHLGQAYYNLERYTDSYETFMGLIEKPEYALRADCMLGLIVAATKGRDEALPRFVSLQAKYNKKQPYYDFILLSLARLYADKNDMTTAITYYQQYARLHDKTLPEDVIYEIGVAYKNAGNVVEAKKYLQMLADNPEASEYYTAVQYLLISMKSGDDPTKVGIEVQSIQELSDQYLSLLIQKNKEMELMNQMLVDLLATGDNNQQTATLDKMNTSKGNIAAINQRLIDMSVGLPPEKLEQLRSLEDKYVGLVSGLAEEALNIQMLKLMPNDTAVQSVQKSINDLDSLYVQTYALQYLANLPEFTDNQYQDATAIAHEELAIRRMKVLWEQVLQQLIDAKKDPVLIEKVRKGALILDENLTRLHTLSELYFGDYVGNESNRVQLRSELDSLMQVRNGLVELRGEVKKSFNQRKAAGMLKDTRERAELDSKYIEAYGVKVNELSKQLDDNSQFFDYTLLDLLFTNEMKDSTVSNQEKGVNSIEKSEAGKQ